MAVAAGLFRMTQGEKSQDRIRNDRSQQNSFRFTGSFDFRIGSSVFLVPIVSSTACGVLCGPISRHSGTNVDESFGLSW